MAKNFPNPFEILGVPSPRELFNDYITLTKRLEKLEKKIEVQGKKIIRLETKLMKIANTAKKARRRKQPQKVGKKTLEKFKKKKKVNNDE